MNRAERRRLAKAGDPVKQEKTYVLTQSQINQMKIDTTSAALDTAFTLLLSIPIRVLGEQYGWDSVEELPTLAECIIAEYEAFQAGDITIQDYQAYVYEHTGLKFAVNDDK